MGARAHTRVPVPTLTRWLPSSTPASGTPPAPSKGRALSAMPPKPSAIPASVSAPCSQGLAATERELPMVLHALDGGYIPAGPSGSPLRGLVNVLPTGRNFYSVDPRALPSPLAWETGQLMADSLLRRHKDDTGEYPKSVGLSVWGTSAMRTSGDDVAEVFALLGIRPRWDEASRRIVGLEPIPLDELLARVEPFRRDDRDVHTCGGKTDEVGVGHVVRGIAQVREAAPGQLAEIRASAGRTRDLVQPRARGGG